MQISRLIGRELSRIFQIRIRELIQKWEYWIGSVILLCFGGSFYLKQPVITTQCFDLGEHRNRVGAHWVCEGVKIRLVRTVVLSASGKWKCEAPICRSRTDFAQCHTSFGQSAAESSIPSFSGSPSRCSGRGRPSGTRLWQWVCVWESGLLYVLWPIKEECVVEYTHTVCLSVASGFRPQLYSPSVSQCAMVCEWMRRWSQQCICGVAPFRFHSLCWLQNRERFGERQPAAAASWLPSVLPGHHIPGELAWCHGLFWKCELKSGPRRKQKT